MIFVQKWDMGRGKTTTIGSPCEYKISKK